MRLGIALWLLVGTAHAQSPALVEADRVRVRAHLEVVERELLAADVAHLTDAQRALRAVHIERLRAYRLRGEFPHGSAAQPAPLSPTFIDADGRACAMGHLIIESGHRAVAETIAREQNYARVPDIVHPALAPWLAANGLTLAEAARIQPTYCGTCFGHGPGVDGGPPVCGANGEAYRSACHAEGCGTVAAGPATCDSTWTCMCLVDGGAAIDAGAPIIDAGAPLFDAGAPRFDAGAPLLDAGAPLIDAGPHRRIVTYGCAATTPGRSAAWPMWASALALFLARRRSR